MQKKPWKKSREQRQMGDPFLCTTPERKAKVKTIEVERIALGVVRIQVSFWVLKSRRENKSFASLYFIQLINWMQISVLYLFVIVLNESYMKYLCQNIDKSSFLCMFYTVKNLDCGHLNQNIILGRHRAIVSLHICTVGMEGTSM